MHLGVNLLILLIGLGSCAAKGNEPVIGGPCQGCEFVFVGAPAELSSSARITAPGEAGEPLVLEGTVRTADGEPAAGIVVYAYHTDAGGVYPKGATGHGRLRAWARTNADGRYRFETIRPGAYPTRVIPEHIHMHVIEPGRATYTIDDVVFVDDPLLTETQRRQHEQGRGGSGVCRPERDANGVWLVRRDIALGKNIPGYRP